MDNTKDLTKNIIDSIQDKKGTDIKEVNLEGLSILADNFIIASGSNERQVAAIAEAVEENASKIGVEPKGIEGKNSGRWILMDYGDVIVHIFHEEDRNFYDLERLWTEGNNIISYDEN